MAFRPLVALLALTAAFTCRPGLAMQEPAPETKPAEVGADRPLAERFRDLKRKIQERSRAQSAELAELRRAGAAGGSPEIRKSIERARRDHGAIRDEVAALIKAHPDDPAAFDGLLLIGAELDDDLAAFVEDRYLGDPRIATLCPLLRHSRRESSRRLLEKIAAEGPDGRSRAQAAYALAESHLARAKGPDASGRDRAMDEAKRHFERIVADHPEERSLEGSYRLADRAKGALAWIANAPSLQVGRVAPAIVGELLDGGRFDLADHRGKVVALVFWGTWCQPCMAMVPHERELVARMKGRPFAFIGVDADRPEDREKALQTTRDEKMDWPSLWDGGFDGPIQARYNVDHYPTVYVLDARGVIRFVDPRGDDLDRAVERLLAEIEPAPASP
ncbi:TlpA family protein disulfide reductase [Paludisphaera soli]|uniref:TlpA family protein disulfide reductase n=1 Tax=Paludisphaera soli TaxID=2712865 RepID=UPI0013EC1AE3|nr:TlpA disulfide reductase family protein [Paludisphaera soli]